MSDPVPTAAQAFLQRFFSPARILVAVSGGSDSKGLLLALKQVLDGGGFEGFSLAACTVDHGLRKGSFDEAQDVGAFCVGLGVPHIIKQWLGDKPASGIQAAARGARYALLRDAAAELGATCIVTAHTADDQAETIAMRKARSAEQSAGLSGMADAVLYDRQVWILRPFLGVRREAIRDYLRRQGEGWFDDPSNTNSAFERVRMRRALLQENGGEGHLPSPQRGEGARRADEGVSPDVLSQLSPSSDPAGHLLPAGEKGKQAAAIVQGSSDFRVEGQRRIARAGRLADLLDHVSVTEGLVARLELGLVSRVDEPDMRDVILLLAATIGGVSHAPGRAVADRVAAFLAGATLGRFTASRAVFDRRRDALYLYREKRGLPVTMLAPGARTIWDGRFFIENRSTQTLRLHAPENAAFAAAWARLFAAGVPQAVARRAAPAMLSIDPTTPDQQDIATIVLRHIPLYDTFLPRFDLTLADRIAVLFGRDRYLASPVHDVLTENARV